MAKELMCGSACVKYILEQFCVSSEKVKNDMIWVAQLALSLKQNGIDNLMVCCYNSSLYNDFLSETNNDFIGFKYLHKLINTNIPLYSKKLSVQELVKELTEYDYIILCVESSKFNKNVNMSGGHFIILNGIKDDKVQVINPIKEKYEIKNISKSFLINCCEQYGSWRILIKGGNV